MKKISLLFVLSLVIIVISTAAKPTQAAINYDNVLAKTKNSSTIYFLSQEKKHTFPSLAVFKTWYSDFSKVITISQEELDEYKTAEEIDFKPGVRLVKTPDDPKVYAIEPGGAIAHIPSEEIARSLYGNNWQQRVLDISVEKLKKYKKSKTKVSSTRYPAGSFVRFGGSELFYINESGNAERIKNKKELANNNFLASQILNSSQSGPSRISKFSSIRINAIKQGLKTRYRKSSSGNSQKQGNQQNNNNNNGNDNNNNSNGNDDDDDDDDDGDDDSEENGESGQGSGGADEGNGEGGENCEGVDAGQDAGSTDGGNGEGGVDVVVPGGEGESEGGNEAVLRQEKQIPQLNAQAGALLEFAIADDIIYYSGDEEDLQYEALLLNGSALPSWLNFDADSQVFSGNIPSDTEGVLQIEVFVRDNNNLEISILIQIEINQ